MSGGRWYGTCASRAITSDGPVAALLPILLRDHPAGETPADDHVLIPHRSPSPFDYVLGSQRNVRSETAASTAVAAKSTPMSPATCVRESPRTVVSRSPLAR